MAGIILKKSNKMHNDLSSFFGATSYMRFTMSMTQFINKTHVEGVQTICLFPYCYLLKDRCQKTHDNHIRKISNFLKLIFLNDFLFHWFSMIFPGKMSFFRADIKFHDFSRQDWNSMTFPGLYEPWLAVAVPEPYNQGWSSRRSAIGHNSGLAVSPNFHLPCRASWWYIYLPELWSYLPTRWKMLITIENQKQWPRCRLAKQGWSIEGNHTLC